MNVEVSSSQRVLNPIRTESTAFPLRELQSVSRQGLFKHITTYLGEYRFNQAIDTYGLIYNGQLQLRGEHESRPLVSQIKQCIESNKAIWRSTHREEADLKGALSLEKQLENAKDGDFVLWASPPEPGSDDYGDHGYIYLGRVSTKSQPGSSKRVDMYSFRINDKNLDSYNKAISRLTGEKINHERPEDFIANPVFFEEFVETNVIGVLSETCNFAQDKYEEKAVAETLRILQPYIHGFIGLVRQGAPKEDLAHAFAAIEKHAIEVWSSIRQSYETNSAIINFEDLTKLSFYALVNRYNGFPLPQAAGSCGPVCSTNIFGKSPLADLLTPTMPCPVCTKTIVVGSESCSNCKTTRAEYKENPEKAKKRFCS